MSIIPQLLANCKQLGRKVAILYAGYNAAPANSRLRVQAAPSLLCICTKLANIYIYIGDVDIFFFLLLRIRWFIMGETLGKGEF
jgi:hypothetical protein